MVREKEFPVYGMNGFRATLLSPARILDNSSEKKLRLEDGREIMVAASDLELKPDGSFYLKNPPGEAAPPVVTGSTYTGEPLFRENCDIRRVPMKRLLDRPEEPRQEGDTLIIPLMEEVLVLEKRLMLREELHITRRREQNPHVSPVRREEFEEPQPID
jgi:hypothetical protein